MSRPNRVSAVAVTIAALALLLPSHRALAQEPFGGRYEPDGRAYDPDAGIVEGGPNQYGAAPVTAETGAGTDGSSTESHLGSCTGWRSDLVPPTSIRVYRTTGDAAGTVQVVPFRSYVGTVIAAEWPGYWPIETLKAGAIGVKQYGWYWARNWRGKTAANGDCYDVVDNTNDQVYRPETKVPVVNHLAAIAATWPLSLRRYDAAAGTSKLFMTGYRAGALDVPCGQDSDGWKMYQWSMYECGKDGLTWEGMLRRYLEPNLEIVDPGDHHIAVGPLGDAAIVVPGSTDGTKQARIYAGRPGWFDAARTVGFSAASTGLLGLVSADVTGDGRDDLVVLHRDGTSAQHLDVHPGTWSGYGARKTWWSSSSDGPSFSNTAIRLVAGDFDGDGRADVGFLVDGSDVTRSAFHVFRSTGSDLAVPRSWWAGTLDAQRASPRAVDATGDGRADVVLEIDRGTSGLRYAVLPSRAAGGSLRALQLWLDLPAARRATTRTVAGDYDRDGRTDLVLAVPAATGTTLMALDSTGSKFVATALWTSPADQPLALSKVKLGAADLNVDGRGDAVIYEDGGSNGTRVKAFISSGKGLVASFSRHDPALLWGTLHAY